MNNLSKGFSPSNNSYLFIYLNDQNFIGKQMPFLIRGNIGKYSFSETNTHFLSSFFSNI